MGNNESLAIRSPAEGVLSPEEYKEHIKLDQAYNEAANLGNNLIATNNKPLIDLSGFGSFGTYILIGAGLVFGIIAIQAIRGR
jgi:hypothetical protein